MILPSQVLFPFTNIRRRALQIRKCSEITASIYIYISIYIHMYICVYTYTRSQRYKHLCKRSVIQRNSRTQYNLELFLYNSILMCSFFLFRKNKMLTWSQQINNSHQCNIFNKSKNIKFKTSDAYSVYTNLLAGHENDIFCISSCTRSS